MLLGTEVGLGPGDIVLDGDRAPPKGHSTPNFLAHVYCGQTAGLIKMPLGTRLRSRPLFSTVVVVINVCRGYSIYSHRNDSHRCTLHKNFASYLPRMNSPKVTT